MSKYVVGVDECGCGALAGPLVVCAAAFRASDTKVTISWAGVGGARTLAVGDSKGVRNPDQRAALSKAVRQAAIGVVIIERTAADIDERLFGTVFPEALQLAAARCIEWLKVVDPTLEPSDVLVLVDGDVTRPSVPCEVRCIPGGDKLDWRIGAASIVAKAQHDVRIDALHAEYPRWGFDSSRGYPTREHKALLAERGPTPAHRKSFRPVRESMPKALGIE